MGKAGDFTHIFNDMLIEAYNNIMKVEEKFLRNNSRIDLSIREMHLLECIGKDREKGKTISEIADSMKVAKPSVTVAVNKLERKGYLEKQGSETDGRIVMVTLTREGRKVYKYHQRYHMEMVHEIEKDFNEEEQEYLLRVVAKLNDFFEKSADK